MAEGGPHRLESLGLTRREAEVLGLLALGHSNADISRVLGISASAVKRNLERIYPKLGVTNRTAAAVRALGVTVTE
jgi:ATP/maltotriose-dependent transcriptional regulator MalT